MSDLRIGSEWPGIAGVQGLQEATDKHLAIDLETLLLTVDPLWQAVHVSKCVASFTTECCLRPYYGTSNAEHETGSGSVLLRLFFSALQCFEADHDASLLRAQIREKPPTIWHLLILHSKTEFLWLVLHLFGAGLEEQLLLRHSWGFCISSFTIHFLTL